LLLLGTAVAMSKYIPLFFLHGPWASQMSFRWTRFFSGWKYGSEVFNICFFILWFLAGAFFYQLYKGLPRDGSSLSFVVYPIMLLFSIPVETRIFSPVIFYTTFIGWFIMSVLFLLLIYRKEWLVFLRYPFLRRIGVISYSIYLIHEDVGVLLINKYGGYLGSFSILAPFIVILICCCFAEISYRYYERKAAAFCRKIPV
jgi:peptidoglycan/LPS O-acetylase OafA/YrhL